MTTFYAVTALHKERDANVCGTVRTIKLSWANGMIGVLPVFKTRKQAMKYYKGEEPIMIETREKAEGGKP